MRKKLYLEELLQSLPSTPHDEIVKNMETPIFVVVLHPHQTSSEEERSHSW